MLFVEGRVEGGESWVLHANFRVDKPCQLKYQRNATVDLSSEPYDVERIMGRDN